MLLLCQGAEVQQLLPSPSLGWSSRGSAAPNVPYAPGQPVLRSFQELEEMLSSARCLRPALGLLPASATGISSLSRLPSPSEGSGYQLSEAPVGVLRAAEPVLRAAAPCPVCRHREPLPGPAAPASSALARLPAVLPAQQLQRPSPRHVPRQHTSPTSRFGVKSPCVKSG